jgi:hypothetical protein
VSRKILLALLVTMALVLPLAGTDATPASAAPGSAPASSVTLIAPPSATQQPDACPPTPIGVVETVRGSLSVSDCWSTQRGVLYYADQYSFTASAGQEVSIAYTPSGFAPYVYLIGPDGEVVGQAHSDFSGQTARIPSGAGFLTLPTSGAYIIEVTSTYTGSTGTYTLRVTALGGGPTLSWVASAPWNGALEGPQDGSGRPWYSPQFDDSGWSAITVPDQDSFGAGYDRFYRADFELSSVPAALPVWFASDDGVWVYVNGALAGHWGGAWRGEGCVNQFELCNSSVSVDPQDIAGFLVPGTNTVAAMVSNGVCCHSYFDFQLLQPLPPFEPFSFAIITDLHVGRYPEYDGDEYYLTQRLKETVQLINENVQSGSNIKFVVVLGDLSEDGTQSQLDKAKSIFDRFDRSIRSCHRQPRCRRQHQRSFGGSVCDSLPGPISQRRTPTDWRIVPGRLRGTWPWRPRLPPKLRLRLPGSEVRWLRLRG